MVSEEVPAPDTQEADVGRDAKRRRRDMRELHSLDAGRDERPRERDWSCNDERYSREERDHDRHEWWGLLIFLIGIIGFDAIDSPQASLCGVSTNLYEGAWCY